LATSRPLGLAGFSASPEQLSIPSVYSFHTFRQEFTFSSQNQSDISIYIGHINDQKVWQAGGKYDEKIVCPRLIHLRFLLG
jgi:hypothetical protein